MHVGQLTALQKLAQRSVAYVINRAYNGKKYVGNLMPLTSVNHELFT